MDILVISDSHGNTERIEALISSARVRPDAIFFLGDGLRDIAWLQCSPPIYPVRGNCDFFQDGTDTDLVITLDGVKIFASHGHKYSVKSGYETMAAKAASIGADVMLFGHTHEALTAFIPAGESVGGVRTEKPLHILNPGSIGSSYDPTFGTIVIKNGQILTAVAGY